MTDVALKRIDALARNRARAELARRNPEEYRKLVAEFKNELRVEYAVTGVEPPRDRNTPLHVEGDDGRCAHCAEKWPCSQKKKRDREAAHRAKRPVPRSFDEVETPV